MIFARDLQDRLVQWKDKKERKPLLIMGVRQVGKTTLIKQFGMENYEQVVYLDFERMPEIHEFFKNTRDPTRLLANLTLIQGSAIDPANTILIFDEIQACSDALVSIKYFYEEMPHIPLIAAGSLLGLVTERSFPVGKVEFLDLQPLSFSEYLKNSQKELFEAYQHFSDAKVMSPIPGAFFNPLMERFSEYMFCGGMPEAAKTFIESSDKVSTRKVHEQILRSYQLDFAKHTTGAISMRIQYVWDSLASQLSKENKKFIYRVIKKGARAREYEEAITWMAQAGLVLQVFRIEKPGFPANHYRDLNAFKLYLLDVGLLTAMASRDPQSIIFPSKIPQEFKGALVENYVAQSMRFAYKSSPHYWTSEGIAEVDFIASHKSDNYPIEVKSGTNVRSKSLAVYGEKYHPKLRLRLSMKNLSKEDDLLNLPIFYADFISKFIDQIQ